MIRKLHNTVMALVACSSLFILALLAGSPLAPAMPIAAVPATTHPAATASIHDAAPRRPAVVRRTGKHRHAMAMPFYSFAPRG